MKRIIAVLIFTALAVSGCSPNEAVSEPETVVVTAAEKSAEERREELEHKIDQLTPIKQATDTNMRNECILAVADDRPDAGDMDVPDVFEFTDLGGKDTQIFSTNVDIRYESKATQTWVTANVFCTVTTRDGVIEETSVVVI